MAHFEVIATGLEFPEGGPIWLNDGSLLLVEIKRGTLTRVYKDGRLSVVAQLGGGPNSSAVGPDGNIYVTQNGGFMWSSIRTSSGVFNAPGSQAIDYKTGSIQKVEISSDLELVNSVSTLYTAGIDIAGNVVPLRGPNDLVFDSSGGFWFTDHGKVRERDRDVTGVFYAKIDGSFCKEVIFPLNSPNGIGLSPDGKVLYVAETPTGRIYKYQVKSPGVLESERGRLLYSAPEGYMFDSLAVDGEGNICVATLGKGSLGKGGISVIKADGSGLHSFLETKDFFTTNICFGGKELRDAYVTLSGSGKLVRTQWHCKGHRCNFEELLRPAMKSNL